jgi:hypothetical protein
VTPPRSVRSARLVDGALRLLAAAVLAFALVTALHDCSQAWDSWYYHLPFAARLAGIVPGDVFVFHAANEARFAGFPLLGERVQGLLWRATGRPESANLVALASVPLLAWFLRRRFAVPLHLSVLALFAVPLVYTHATSAYVDLPANAALSVALLLAIASYASPAAVTPRTLASAGAAAAIAANMKALLHPLAALAIVALALRAMPALVRDLRGDTARSGVGPAREDAAGRSPLTARARALLTLLAVGVGLPVIFATPLANLVAHGNPYYPLRMTLLGHVLPGTEAPYASSPPWLADAPRPLRFLCSLLEIGVRPITDERRWTVDQWMPDDSTGNRMGGFFGAYVVVNLLLLAWRAARERSGEARAAAGGFAIFSVALSWMPQSHELRYYLCWMIVLVGTNLWLACRPGAPDAPARGRAIGVGAALALAFVLVVTRAAYVLPVGSRFEGLLASKVPAGALDSIADGERVCVRREPWNLLWAATFHAPKRYVVVEAEDAEGCGSARPAP